MAKNKDELEKEADRLLRKAESKERSPEKQSHKNKLASKYDYQRRMLKKMLTESGKWSEDMRAQLVLAARTGALCSEIWEALEQEDKLTIEEKSREGETRKKVNPLVSMYLTVDAAYRRNLRALKLNREKEANDPPHDTDEDKDALARVMSDED